MTQEDKNLIITDIGSRLPYGVKILVNGKIETVQGINVLNNTVQYGTSLQANIEEVKPCLFPMSSMTKEQKKEYNNLNLYEPGWFPHLEESLQYLIANKFDYNDLIYKGIAVDVTALNIY
jgi:hypothetical protein